MATTRRGQKSSNEDRPLLEVTQQSKPTPHYDSASGQQSSNSGRAKLRFAVRRQILSQRRQEKAGGGTYKSIFAPKPRAATVKQTQDPNNHVHSALYNYLNPKSHSSSARCFQRFITVVILVDVIFYIVSTEPKYEGVPLFYYAECITSSIFLIEYLSRLWVCTEQVS